jgi:branched-chain amino acid transport system substrate-binding protein
MLKRLACLTAILLLTTPGAASAQKKYGPGVSDTEIKIGSTAPLSGPVSAFSAIGLAAAGYFKKINDDGGINGRQINLLLMDDGFSPPRTVEQVRKLVEQDQVLAIFGLVGTGTNTVVQKYLAAQKVPQLFAATGATKWGDPQNFPGTIGWQPSYQSEAKAYVDYALAQRPNAKIAVLYPNDDSGKDYLAGIKRALGARAGSVIVSEISYESSDPNVDSQVVSFKSSGADVFMNMATPRTAAQAIRKAYDIEWKPLQFVINASASVGAVLEPAGLERSVGLVSSAYLKDPTEAQWVNDPGYKDWAAWMAKYYPQGNTKDILAVYGYSIAQTLAYVIKQCGDDLTRENLLKHATAIKGLQLPMVQPGVTVNTSPTDYFPIKQQRMKRFDGKEWILFGDLVGG